MSDVIMLSGEPYLSVDVLAKTDPEEFIWHEEMDDFIKHQERAAELYADADADAAERI